VNFNMATRELLYEVEVSSSRSNSRVMLEQDKLAYAPGCRVIYSPSGLFEGDTRVLKGEVLLCRLPSFHYTLMICNTDGHDNEMIENVTSRCIMYDIRGGRGGGHGGPKNCYHRDQVSSLMCNDITSFDV
jgi:hypothetical protein